MTINLKLGFTHHPFKDVYTTEKNSRSYPP